MNLDIFSAGLSLLASTSGAVTVMREYVAPTIKTLAALASVACAFFIMQGGYQYMTSRGNPEGLEQAKRVLRNALIGLVLVFAAATLTTILTGAYGDPSGTSNATLPNLQAIEPADPGNGLVDVIIKAVTGFLNNIIQAVGAPFLSALDYFTKETPLMAKNSTVFNFWLAMVGITNVLFILVVALIGFHVMSASSFGFDEIEFKHLLPRLGLAFLLINTSIFFIDAIIELSNVLITAINNVSGASSVWSTLTSVVKESGGQGAAALIIMVVFLILAVMLLVYYVGRLVVLFLGAVLAPLVVVLWLIPAFRDFAASAVKTYITTIFVLFVHVVTLQLAASLFTGMSATSGNDVPNTLMAMVIGLATAIALLKTQGIMMQFSYVSMGAKNARKLGSQFMNGVSYMTGKGRGLAAAAHARTDKAQLANSMKRVENSALKSGQTRSMTYQNKKGNADVTYSVEPLKQPSSRGKTGSTSEAPKVTPRSEAAKKENLK